MMPTLHSHTHCQAAPANAKTKAWQRVCLSNRTEEKINNEGTTRGIKHWGLSGYSNILPRIKFGVTGQESSPQSPTISYRHPLAVILKTRRHNGMTRKIIIGILPVIVGGLIYLTYRTDTLIMFDWFNKIGLSDSVDFLRSNQHLQNLTIPSWIKFSLPDALWLFSFNYVLLALWNFNINRQSAFWLFLAPTIGLFSEIGQFFGIVPGTFDIVDLVLLVFATLTPFLLVNNFKLIKIKFV